MATQDDIEEALLEAKLAILTKVKERAAGNATAEVLKATAEAYAWLASPNNGH